MTSISDADSGFNSRRQPWYLRAHHEILPDHDLLDLLLQRTGPHAGALAGRLLDHFGCLEALTASDPCELLRIDGMPPEVVSDLKLVRELAIRLVRVRAARPTAVSSWSALLDYVRAALSQEPREQFRALYLDRRNALIRDEFVTHGTVDHAPVYPREVVRRALELSASAMVLVHNHPSGDPTPSRPDIDMTRRIVEAARVFDIQVHDHVVVGRDGTASFRSLGLM